MVVKRAWIPCNGTISVGSTSNPIDPTIQVLSRNDIAPRDETGEEEEVFVGCEDLLKDNDSLKQFLDIAALANLASVHETPEGWKARGDPTDIAIQVFASRFNWNRTRWTSETNPIWTQIAEYPFDSSIKKMSVIFETESESMIFTKGAVERVLDSCFTIASTDGDVELTDTMQDLILENMEALANQGLRVLALASKKLSDNISAIKPPEREDVERDLIFRGLIGLYDPPRLETAGAVRECHASGIVVHMLTGDHPSTARAIALQVGILPSDMASIAQDKLDTMVMTASQFDQLSEDEIDALPLLPLVIARCSPTTKVNMIEALHRRGKFAAMTGDGVNDSPSLKRADVGIAMGQAGSDVAKDASDIVLTDDNFASIINAVEEGRRMFDNIQKFILHLLAQNIAQALTLLVGLAFKDTSSLSVFPLAPVEILWIIMIASGMPDMGLGFEAAAPGIMSRPPHPLRVGVFTKEILLDMLVYGLWMAALCLSAFSIVMFGLGDGDLSNGCNDRYTTGCDTVFRARATTFVCVTWFGLFLAWEMVDMRRSFFRMQPKTQYPLTQWARDVWKNQFLFWAVMAGFITVFPTLYIPVINHKVFKHTGITWEWGVVFIEAILFFAGCEAWKWGKRIYFRRQAIKNGGGREIDLETLAFKIYFD